MYYQFFLGKKSISYMMYNTFLNRPSGIWTTPSVVQHTSLSQPGGVKQAWCGVCKK
jgi:hypothetical protein